MLSDINFKDLKLEASFKNVKMSEYSTSSLEMFSSKEYGSVSTRTHDESSEKPFLFHLDTVNKGQVFSNKKVCSMNVCRHISASALLAHWDRMGVVDAEEVLADLGVGNMAEGIAVEQLDTWCREQVMLGIEMIRWVIYALSVCFNR